MAVSVASRIALATGLSGVVGISWMIKDVQSCDVPVDSLLNYVSQTQKVWYSDCYRTPIRSRVRCGSDARAADAMCKAFFRSWPMQMELWLVSHAGHELATPEQILQTEFAEEDSVSLFRVALRGPGEVLFDSYNTFAFTWMGVSRDADGYITDVKFGSALTGAGYRGISLQSYMMYQLVMPFHYLYSRILLVEAAKQLQVDLA